MYIFFLIIFAHQIYCRMHIWVMVDLLKYLMVKHVASFNLSCNKFLCKQGSVAIAECLRHHFTLMMQRGKNILKVIITSFINSMKANPETQICFSICPHNVCLEWGESLWRMHFFVNLRAFAGNSATPGCRATSPTRPRRSTTWTCWSPDGIGQS